MSARMMIEVHRAEGGAPARVTVVREGDLEASYERLLGLVLRLGAWLESPQALLLPRREWEARFAVYQEQRERLRELGERLRAGSPRGSRGSVPGDLLLSSGCRA